jgi:hypothetical protein
MPQSIPIGLARMNSQKTMMVQGPEIGWSFVLNVVPTEQATGILWMITLVAKIAIEPTSSNTPMARPSINE